MNARNQSLDVLRGTAVLLVLLFHLEVPVVGRGGWVGVDLFFVLSGFLISGILFRDFGQNGEMNLRRFWSRRAFRILPPLYVFLTAMGALMLALHALSGRAFASAVLFYSNYLPNPNNDGSIIGHTWSLAIEEHFYLLFPLLLWLLVRYGSRRRPFSLLPAIFVLLAAACFTFRTFASGHCVLTHQRADALFAGVTLRYLEHFRRAWFERLFGSPISLIVGLSFWVPPYAMEHPAMIARSAGYTWTALSASFLIGWCLLHEHHRWWNVPASRVLAMVGFSSYSIYLWQQPVALFFRNIEPTIFFKPYGLLFSVGLGIGMARLVEMPALSLRDRLTSQKRLPDSVCSTSPLEGRALCADVSRPA